MVLRDPYPGLAHQFSVVLGLVWFKQCRLFTLGCTQTGSALLCSNLSCFSNRGGYLLVFTSVWSSRHIQPGGKEGACTAEGAVKHEAPLLLGAAGCQKDLGCQKEDLAPFQALASATLLTLWFAPFLAASQLLAGFLWGLLVCGGSRTSCFWWLQAAGSIHCGS